MQLRIENEKANACKPKKHIGMCRVIFILSFILIPTVYFAVFYVYVNLNSFLMAFQINRNGVVSWTLENFQRFFTELSTNGSEMGQAFLNTFYTFLISQAMFLVSFFVSYFLYKKIFMYRVFRVCFFLPSLVAGTVINSIYMQFVSINGPVPIVIQHLAGLEYAPDMLADSRFANLAIWLNLIWLNFPGNMVLFGGAFSRIPESVLESARLDGVSWVREIFQIIVPMVWPTVGMLLMLNIAGIFGSNGNVFLLTKGDYGTQTLANWMYMQVYNMSGDPTQSNAFNYMSAVGLFLTVISVTLALTLRKISDKAFGEVQY